ncbi:phosphoesterase RecJ domain-containing protein [Ruminococcus sp. YE71]|uniref:DHH family phosphoesterase n=1 Tax=unclassified Ruminococcus TaxID=2608920 RepID=UPI00088C207E|nr:MULTISPECIES: bifunctional oligoribonuclease/PAP phosphatase NrnA [unclassified Ruminococcus]SDA22859.1 phosphoesterase RecJ domain-containing protein [Ruminococcus sp. YE78]SFW38909.1 phosphoesterase RecJ domain-containing protein [Ruminococcus sp. YE71]
MEFAELKKYLDEHDRYLILTHKSPDGDTVGCGFGLCSMLRRMGKQANVTNSEPFPDRYSFLYEGYYTQDFEPQTIIAVDIADEQLLGSGLSQYAGRIDLCIDHHISNKMFAKETVLDASAAAAAQIIFAFAEDQGIELNDIEAMCLYTGIATDTGCFKFSNTTPDTHIAAAKLMGYDFDFALINRKMFDLKSRARMHIEQMMTKDMEFWFGGRCTVITLTTELMEKSGADPAEFDGLAQLPLSVEGAVMGITIKQRHEDRFKLSVRTTEEADASAFCKRFGGGGHIRAAGCEIKGTLEEVKAQVKAAVKEVLDG